MTRTKLTKLSVFKAATTRLEKNVMAWWLERSDGYESLIGPLWELFYGGCASGLVGHLIYYKDTLAFYKKYKGEIAALLQRELAETGCTIAELLPDWDTSDPLGLGTQNQNLLAWFGFETAARDLADRLGLDP